MINTKQQTKSSVQDSQKASHIDLFSWYHKVVIIFRDYLLYTGYKVLFTRKGKCKQCGKCCRHVYLRDGGRMVQDFNDCLKLIKNDSRMKQFVAKGKNEQGNLYFACVHVTRKNTCGLYASRPRLCRTYPHISMLRYGAVPKEECGFYFVNRFTGRKV